MNYKKTVYRLYECQNKQTHRFVKYFPNVNQANDYVDALVEAEKNVLVPVMYVCNDTVKRGYALSDKEYLLLRLIKPWEEQEQVTTVFNEYGRATKCAAINTENSKIRYQIVRIEPHYIEERFRVAGRDGLFTCQEIFDNLISKLSEDPYTTIRMMVLANKLILDYGAEYDFILCKNSHDSVRLYNAIQRLAKERKLKRLFCFGYVNKTDKHKWIGRLRDTGIPERIVRSTMLLH